MPDRIIAYRLICTDTAEDMEDQVAKWLHQGYQPLGPPVIGVGSGDYRIIQAMVRRDGSP